MNLPGGWKKFCAPEVNNLLDHDLQTGDILHFSHFYARMLSTRFVNIGVDEKWATPTFLLIIEEHVLQAEKQVS